MPYSGSFVVSPGMTTTVPIALEMNLVTISWSVEPTVIQDKYEIKITQTFETNVPAPVLIVEPPNMTLPNLQPGQVFNGEFKVTNYGLIEVYDVTLDFPKSIDDYDIEVLTSAIPNKIGAMQSITVPYRITRRITTAGNKTLCEEVQGYGGGSCVKNVQITIRGKCIICPNSAYARVVEKITNFILNLFYDCPSNFNPSTPPTYVLPGGTGIYITPSGGQGGGGGGLPGASPVPIKTGNPCECKVNCTPCTTDSISNGVCVGSCTAMPQNDPDDCNKAICDVNGGIISVPNDDEIPHQNDPKDCKREVCIKGSPRSIPDDDETPLQLSTHDCKKEICEIGVPVSVSVSDDSDEPWQISPNDCQIEVCEWRGGGVRLCIVAFGPANLIKLSLHGTETKSAQGR